MLVSCKSTRRVVRRTKFGEWLANNIYNNNMTIYQLADKMHLRRETISYHLNGLRKPPFSQVLAYCYVFEKMSNTTFDPEAIYKMVDEEL